MAGNNTIRLVSGGTLQVRTGVLKGVGPTGPQGATGATGPAPAITASITGVSYGTNPTVTVTNPTTGTYNLAFSIPTQGPTIAATATALSAGASPTASVSQVGSTYTINLGIPAGLSNGGQGVGFQDFDYVSGLKMSVTPTATGTGVTTVTAADAGGKAVCALLVYYNSLGGSYVYANWRLTVSGTDYTISTVNSATGVITLTAATTTTSGTTYAIRNVVVDSRTASETLTSTTTEQALPIPGAGNKPVIPSIFNSVVTAMEKYLVGRFATAAARTSARGTRVKGEVTFLNDDSSLWVRAADSVATAGQDNVLAQVRVSSSDAPASGTYPQGTIWLKV